MRSSIALARWVAIALVVGMLGWPAARIATAAPSALVRMGFLDGDANAEPYYAQEKQIFARYGLTVTTRGNLGGANVLRALKAGTIDVGFANVVSLAGEVLTAATIQPPLDVAARYGIISPMQAMALIGRLR
jgi:ABC-type nitrate/sulfonate/bicarbonate transport system substrate-binding protein